MDEQMTWWFGQRIPRSQVPKLNTEPPPHIEGDWLDDDYYRWVRTQKPLGEGFRRVEELSEKLRS